jgi:hypothetical protein
VCIQRVRGPVRVAVPTRAIGDGLAVANPNPSNVKALELSPPRLLLLLPTAAAAAVLPVRLAV